MIATTTGGIAHGTSASTRVSPCSRRPELSNSARPIAAASCSTVTPTVQIMPIRSESQNRLFSARRPKLSKPAKA